jgi:hypothetical protein
MEGIGADGLWLLKSVRLNRHLHLVLMFRVWVELILHVRLK